MHNFCVQDLEIINSNGQKYFKKVTSELSKNHQGKTNEFEGTGGRMYATDAVQLCPVQSFEKKLSKRHAGTNRPFLHSKKKSFQMMRQYGIGTNPWVLNTLEKKYEKHIKICWTF